MRNQRLNKHVESSVSEPQKNDSTILLLSAKEFRVARFRGQDCKLIDAFLCIILCNLITILNRVVYQMQKKNMHSAFKVIILLFGRLLEDSDSYNSLFWLC